MLPCPCALVHVMSKIKLHENKTISTKIFIEQCIIVMYTGCLAQVHAIRFNGCKHKLFVMYTKYVRIITFL